MTKTIEEAASEASLNRGRGVIIQADLNGNIVKRWNCVKDIQSAMGCSTGCLSECLNRKVKYHKGYIWVYEKGTCLIPQIVKQINISRDSVVIDGEEWRDIVGYEQYYQVSNYGRVKSLKRSKHPHEHILKPKNGSDGYFRISLYQGKNYKRFLIHRIIAEAFIPNPNNLPQIDHINTIRDDNRIENLRWVTPKENMNNPLTRLRCSDTGKRKYKDGTCLIANISRRRVRMLNKQGIALKEFNSIKDAAKEVGVSYTSISNVLRGWSKSCRGYLWEYA